MPYIPYVLYCSRFEEWGCLEIFSLDAYGWRLMNSQHICLFRIETERSRISITWFSVWPLQRYMSSTKGNQFAVQFQRTYRICWRNWKRNVFFVMSSWKRRSLSHVMLQKRRNTCWTHEFLPSNVIEIEITGRFIRWHDIHRRNSRWASHVASCCYN